MQEDFDKLKAQCLDDIEEALPRYRERLDAIDPRLCIYIDDAISNHGSHSNIYEDLGIRKCLRLMDSYEIDVDRVQRTLRAIEGVWRDGKHVKGGLKFDTPRGNHHVRLMPYQAWCIFGIYSFVVEVCMERSYDGGDLLPTEYVVDGMVWDKRRLCSEADIFQTRKSGKTEFGAAIDFVEVCFLGPANGQALICAPTAELSQIAYKAIKEFAAQIDPTCLNRMGGKYFRMTARGLNWQPGHRMKGEIKCMAAGKTPKDGLFASVVHADEHGQPGYINGRCDMQSAVETCFGSTGPRREKLLLHTTTAGLNMEGPYKNHLKQVEAQLLLELDIPLDGQPHRTDNDYHFAFLLQLDPKEQSYDLDQLDDPELFRKVNRSIGITVQPTYYRQRLHDARLSEDTRKEVLTKDMNIWQRGQTVDWITPEEIRAIQVPMTIDDCTADKGWEVMVGSDFSKGDDLNGNAYLAKRWREDLQEMEYFGDLDAYMSEDAVRENPIRDLLLKWADEGWLHIVPGKTFDPAVAVNRIVELDAKNVNFFGFGYDPYNAKTVINALTQWIVDIGLDPKTLIRPVRQNFATYSPAVKEFDYMVRRGIQTPDGKVTPNPMIHLSSNPLWPWEFGNVSLQESSDGMENLKPVKANSSASCKVDNVQMLLSALILHDAADGDIKPD